MSGYGILACRFNDGHTDACTGRCAGELPKTLSIRSRNGVSSDDC
jgi:hypothetical protein